MWRKRFSGMFWVEEIHLVGTINNVETSYFTWLKTENMTIGTPMIIFIYIFIHHQDGSTVEIRRLNKI